MEPILPDGGRVAKELAGTAYASGVVAGADQVLKHEFPLLGRSVSTGPDIRWDRDHVNDIEWSGSHFLRRIPYLDSDRVGDHKFVWELNRHQHLVLLAQARLLTGRQEYIAELEVQLVGWIGAHPYARGMQWVSALEVAFRLLSWLWVWHLVHRQMSVDCRRLLLVAIWQHGVFLERNLSVYYSPNTHLLGEAVALHAVARLFPDLPGSERWRELGRQVVHEQMDRQIRGDGSHFEQSSYYHVYACDFFLFHTVLEEAPNGYRKRLRQAGQYLWDLMGPAGRIPFLGDDDGGRLFHPYGERSSFGRATLVALGAYFDEEQWRGSVDEVAEIGAWWLGSAVLVGARDGWVPWGESSVYSDARVITLWRDNRQVIIDVAGLGATPAGHSHAHALSIVVRDGEYELLTDPGTYTYAGSARWRSVFRSTAMHNTVVIPGFDQARPAGPFRWEQRPECKVIESGPHFVEAVCEYAGCTHTRRVELHLARVVVIDTVEAPTGTPKVEQHWHAGVGALQQESHVFALGHGATLHLSDQLTIFHERGGDTGWISPVYGLKSEADALRGEYGGAYPVKLKTEVVFGPTA